MGMTNAMSLPMTETEKLLKHFLDKRPDIWETIPDGDGFVRYIAWMTAEYTKNARDAEDGQEPITLEGLNVPVSNMDQRAMAEQLIKKPGDAAAISTLSADFAVQSEQWNIRAGHDISMTRMVRYLPSPWHTTEFFEVYYAPDGRCTIHFAEETVELSRGAVLIVAPGILRATPCYGDDALLYSFIIRRSTFEHVFWNQFPESSLLTVFFRRALSGGSDASWLYFETQQDEDLFAVCRRMLTEYQQNGSYNTQMMNALMTLFFILLLKQYESTARLPRTSDFRWKHEYSAILSFIQQHYMEAGIVDVAREFNYSTRQISRVIRDCLGLSYARLILKLRMEQAAALLNEDDMTVAQIGSAVGYADTSSFCRAFSAYYGCTPKEKRNGCLTPVPL